MESHGRGWSRGARGTAGPVLREDVSGCHRESGSQSQGAGGWCLGHAGARGGGWGMENKGKDWRKGKELNSQVCGLGTGRLVCQEHREGCGPGEEHREKFCKFTSDIMSLRGLWNI